MDQVPVPLEGSHAVSSLNEMCLKSLAKNLPSDAHLRVRQLLPYLQPDDAVEVLDRFILLHVSIQHSVFLCMYFVSLRYSIDGW